MSSQKRRVNDGFWVFTENCENLDLSMVLCRERISPSPSSFGIKMVRKPLGLQPVSRCRYLVVGTQQNFSKPLTDTAIVFGHQNPHHLSSLLLLHAQRPNRWGAPEQTHRSRVDQLSPLSAL